MTSPTQQERSLNWPFPPPGGPVPVKSQPENPLRHDDDALM